MPMKWLVFLRLFNGNRVTKEENSLIFYPRTQIQAIEMLP